MTNKEGKQGWLLSSRATRIKPVEEEEKEERETKKLDYDDGISLSVVYSVYCCVT
jgi:hypothetical protein